MLSAIDIPKSKSISIAWIGLKCSILGIFLTLSYPQVSSIQQCTDTSLQLAIIFKLFFILSSSLDLCLLIYFLCTKTFKRMEYYVLFGFHLLMFIIFGIVCIVQAMKGQCQLLGTFLGACFVLLLNFVAVSVLVMWSNLYFGLKFAHFAGQILWTFMWLQTRNCNNIILTTIGLIHGFLSIIGLVIFLIINILKKNSTTAKCWRQLYIISIALMIICYILSFVVQASLGTCANGLLFVKTYQKYGLIEFISPILLLVFLNTQMGDPRDTILKEGINKVHGSTNNYQGIIIDDTN